MFFKLLKEGIFLLYSLDSQFLRTFLKMQKSIQAPILLRNLTEFRVQKRNESIICANGSAHKGSRPNCFRSINILNNNDESH